ncbi:hypothetical protein IEQ34_008145 [Dendrobium chrysotoxum]|uniref:Histone deacetylase complex subunit SAP30 Sin3 binding domain-containing protein n=1 Tax=Dendrobium chrysotoxum TaxID=161865 RepID=A0AAV7H7S6_DENCH|nr:hypothetical protein IEQ34_008145 [Dendrobium chrysotoxum]
MRALLHSQPSMMIEAELCSSRVLSPSREESGDEELSVLPRHTKVIVTGNNRTKSVLVGLQGVVKKAVGLGGWHWLVLKNGVEVKLQRNALSVLEAPTGNEEDDDEMDCDNSFCSSSDMGDKDGDYPSIEFHKPTKPRVRHTRPWTSSAKSTNRSSFRDLQANSHKPHLTTISSITKRKLQLPHFSIHFHHVSLLLAPNESLFCPVVLFSSTLLLLGCSKIILQRVNLAKLGTATLWRYWKHFNLVSINPNPSKQQLISGVQHHFLSQQVDEMQVIVGFIHTAKRLKTPY